MLTRKFDEVRYSDIERKAIAGTERLDDNARDSHNLFVQSYYHVHIQTLNYYNLQKL